MFQSEDAIIDLPPKSISMIHRAQDDWLINISRRARRIGRWLIQGAGQFMVNLLNLCRL